ncbi:MAG: DMT family transporter, partial [Verrucomicrobiota bacterium]|nr:DMT family transporter [Verrucomicrobiota bacterium]
MFIWTIVALSILAGALIATQGPINAELSRLTGHPLSAAAMSSMMTASILLTLAVVSRAPMPEIGRLAAAPWWIVVGGGLIGV